MSITTPRHPFSFNGSLGITRYTNLNRFLETSLEKILGLQKLGDIYQQLPSGQSNRDFLQSVFDHFHIQYTATKDDSGHIPASGGGIVVANHPFGALEGMILAHILLGVRKDVRILANEYLERIPEINDIFFTVNVFGGTHAINRNMRPLRRAIQWVKNGGLLVVFPAGEVSHLNIKEKRIVDPEWSSTIGRLVRITRAPVTPVYCCGSNRWLFHVLGIVHPRLRTALLPRELLNKADKRVELRIGKSIDFHKLRNMNDDRELTKYLRIHTYALKILSASSQQRKQTNTNMEPVIDGPNKRLLSAEIESLPASQHLNELGGMSVYYAHSQQIPWVLQEVGRLREITFRASGEGTGSSTDIDLFDSYYLHLVVWNPDTKEIVGAYRMGLVDEILSTFGIKGLYTYTLFKYNKKLLDSISPAIELGRSFIRAEYQRNLTPLLLLWKGIGEYCVRNPHYKILFGPVSISNDYETVTQRLMVDFLRINSYESSLAKYVKPRHPLHGSQIKNLHENDMSTLKSIEDISEIITRLEQDEKGVPVLIKQYLKLGGTFLGFNIDKDFSDALDGLIMVDLTRADTRVMQRYFGGAEGTKKIKDYHKSNLSKAS
jgi:putative hemolysin